ncbi:unnamed protein product, partial [Musa textilis]
GKLGEKYIFNIRKEIKVIERTIKKNSKRFRFTLNNQSQFEHQHGDWSKPIFF